ncbi:MAG: GNAT family N-acetyltransferase [Anaerostipes sp.]|jgi:ribosomal protein S18 acetylase RimI-like enzyme|nr:GNAT family N-acetyltransferase [Anaerostipes sp.]
MKETIIFREYERSDYQALSEIIEETWTYDKLCSKKTARKMSNAFLDHCLTNQTYTQVALVDGVPAGVIMGKNQQSHKCPLKFKLGFLQSVFSLFCSKEGRRLANIFSCFDDINAQLLKKSPIKYQGEISFFAINSKYRGRGLGKELFQIMAEYMKEENVRNFFLFTDTTCNYHFYERQGMTRRGEKKHFFEVEGPFAEQTLFIYDYQLQ